MRQILTSRHIMMLLIAAAVIGVAAFSLVERSRAHAEPPAAAAEAAGLGKTVRVGVAERRTGFEVRRSFTGRIEARRRAELSFERMDVLTAVHVDEGDRVKAGQLLAELDRRALNIALRLEKAKRRVAQAVLQELVRGPRQTDIAASRAELDDLKVQLEWSRTREQRREGLLAKRAISKETLQAAGFETEALDARRRAADQRLAELLEGTRPEKVEAQKARVAAIDAAVSRIELDLEKSRLRAPFDGRIARRYFDQGIVARPGTIVLEVIESSALEARIGVPQGEADSLTAGQVVELNSEGRFFEATFRNASPFLDERTRQRLLIFDLPSTAKLVDGQIIRWERGRLIEEAGFWLPRTALVKSVRGLWACFVIQDGGDGPRVARRAVEVLHNEDSKVYVRGTLRDGEAFVADGAQRIAPGQLVNPKQN